ncbi:protein of unknown function [Nocardia cyriacigeorgica GUH-2]|uniref:Uncharacterized protein n=1 Tax=Nocardia cyriacigeorgica (strain GUH-2) TaxID=1127134 RepID=H6QY29_NOCCG|nr:protein of unknown function [Nocardia cyriacigeorgica GUH-2]
MHFCKSRRKTRGIEIYPQGTAHG